MLPNFFSMLIEVCLSCVLGCAFYLFLSDGIDRHMSEPLIIKNTDVFPAVLL